MLNQRSYRHCRCQLDSLREQRTKNNKKKKEIHYCSSGWNSKTPLVEALQVFLDISPWQKSERRKVWMLGKVPSSSGDGYNDGWWQNPFYYRFPLLERSIGKLPPPKKTKNIPQKLTKLYGSGVIPVKNLRSQFWSVEEGDGLGIDVDHQDTTLKQRPVEEFLSFFLFLPL